MNISAFCLITNPDEREDPWLESIESVLNFADEVVVIDGSHFHTYLDNQRKLMNLAAGKKILHEHLFWDQNNWSWDEFPKRFNLALQMCRGHWAIRFDVDYVFTEEWKEKIQEWVWVNKNKRIITFQKVSSVLATRFYQKGPVALGFNKKYGDTAFGIADEKYTDLCNPIVKRGVNRDGVAIGKLVPEQMRGRSSLKFYNYDYCFKTEENTANEFYRFSMAHFKHYGWTKLGTTPKESLAKFIIMMQERLNKCPYTIPYQDQPIFIQKRLNSITPMHFGHSGWGKIVDNGAGRPV